MNDYLLFNYIDSIYDHNEILMMTIKWDFSQSFPFDSLRCGIFSAPPIAATTKNLSTAANAVSHLFYDVIQFN